MVEMRARAPGKKGLGRREGSSACRILYMLRVPAARSFVLR